MRFLQYTSIISPYICRLLFLMQIYSVVYEAVNFYIMQDTVAVYHRGYPCWNPGHSIWGLQWTKWHWDMFLPGSILRRFRQCHSIKYPYLPQIFWLFVSDGQTGVSWEPNNTLKYDKNINKIYAFVRKNPKHFTPP